MLVGMVEPILEISRSHCSDQMQGEHRPNAVGRGRDPGVGGGERVGRIKLCFQQLYDLVRERSVCSPLSEQQSRLSHPPAVSLPLESSQIAIGHCSQVNVSVDSSRQAGPAVGNPIDPATGAVHTIPLMALACVTPVEHRHASVRAAG